MPRVRLTRQAIRQFHVLPQNLQEPVLNALTELEIDPVATGKPLLGRLKGLWSARVGSYRIIYSIEGSRRSPRVIVVPSSIARTATGLWPIDTVPASLATAVAVDM